MREARYKGWGGALGSAILDGSETLVSLEEKVASGTIDLQPVSGHQELLENVVNESTWAATSARVETARR
jgi:xylose isomerase